MLRICVIICRNLPYPQQLLATRLSCSTIHIKCNMFLFVIRQVYFQDKTSLAHQNIMGYTKLLAKLSGDMIAREAGYHNHCMTKSRNKFRKFSNDQENHVKVVQENLEAIAVAEWMLFIKDSLQSSDKVVSFTKSLYENFIVIVLKAPVVSVHATRMKKNNKKKKKKIKTKATNLSRAAQIIRNENFEKHWHITGSFTDNRQNE